MKFKSIAYHGFGMQLPPKSQVPASIPSGMTIVAHTPDSENTLYYLAPLESIRSSQCGKPLLKTGCPFSHWSADINDACASLGLEFPDMKHDWFVATTTIIVEQSN